MNASLTQAILAVTLFASVARAQTVWTIHNDCLNFNRILVSGRVAETLVLAATKSNGLSVAQAIEATGETTLPADELRLTVCPKAAFLAPTNSTGVVSGLADCSDILARKLKAGDSLFVHARNSVGVGTNLQILAIGEIKAEGVVMFQDPRSCTVLHLILKLGGLPPYANPHGIRMIRVLTTGDIAVRLIDVQRILKEGNPDHDVRLRDGDIVLFPRRKVDLF